MRQKMAITFEIEESIVFRKGGECSHSKRMSFLKEQRRMEVLSGLPAAEVSRLVEAARINCADADHVLICLNCLLKFAEELTRYEN